MPDATHAISNFLGGEISQLAQGRFDRPDYRVSMNKCLNAFPVEIGGWVRRPGTAHAGITRGGKPARVIKFDFEQSSPYTMEFTDGYLRFRSGIALATTNDAQSVQAWGISNPVYMQVAAAWPTGTVVTLLNAAANCPKLLNRTFLTTQMDATHMSLQDPVTGANIDAATLGTIGSGMSVARIQELQTVYGSGSWSAVRAVQAENTDILLHGSFPPQSLNVTSLPTDTNSAIFSIGPSTLIDGPYLDPFTNGVQAVASALSGIITLTLSFPTWSSTTAYAAKQFVTSSGVNYISLQDQNVNETPASSPTFWKAVSASAAIGPNGFQATDVGRLVRLFSEPAAWVTSGGYASGVVVSYNPSGVPGATTYWQSLAGSNNAVPGADLTHWEIVPQGAAIWTWGRITSLSNIIDRALSGSSAIGSMVLSGGLAASFDGVFSKPVATSSVNGVNGSGFFPQGTQVSIGGYVGKAYVGASAQKIQQGTLYPSSDEGIVSGTSFIINGHINLPLQPTVTINMRAKQTAPTGSNDGTILGTSSVTANTLSAVTIVSNDQNTAWNYVWFEILANANLSADSSSYNFNVISAQVSFFNPPTSATTSAGVNVEILGPPLLYSQPVVTWRLGVFSQTTGYPTCGTWHEGRIWFGGAVANRFDASVSNSISGNNINMAPTDQFGVVSASSAISEVINSDTANPIHAFEPDLQGILAFTQGGEFLIQAPTNGPMSATNIAVRRVTKIGSAFVEPRRTDHTLVFVQRYGQKLMEDFADVFSGKFSAPNLAERAQHITAAGIAELAYCSAATPIIWGRDNDDALFGITYKRDTLTTSQGPTYAAWHRHALGSGRDVESICGGPSANGDLDALTMVTNDPATNIHHVEVMTDVPEETTALADCWFLDNAAQPTSYSSSSTPVTGAPYGGLTINGLWHLNGATVQVFAGGLDCGDPGDNKGTFSDFTVANGSVFVPYGDGVSAGSGAGLFAAGFVSSFAAGIPLVIGFTYDSDGQIVRPILPQDTGSRTGPALAKTRRPSRYGMLVSNTRGLSIGASFGTLDPVNFNQNGTTLGTLALFSGIAQNTITADSDYDGMVCWRASRPNSPANIAALALNIQTQDT